MDPKLTFADLEQIASALGVPIVLPFPMWSRTGWYPISRVIVLEARDWHPLVLAHELAHSVAPRLRPRIEDRYNFAITLPQVNIHCRAIRVEEAIADAAATELTGFTRADVDFISGYPPVTPLTLTAAYVAARAKETVAHLLSLRGTP